MANKTLERLDAVIEDLQRDIITSISNIHMLNDINTLIDEKNRIVMSNPVLFKSIIREFEMSLSIKLERDLEDGRKANVSEVLELVEHFKHTIKDKQKQDILEAAFLMLQDARKHAVTIGSRTWRNNRFAHLSRDLQSLEGVTIKYEDFYATFNIMAEALNQISGVFWDKSTASRIVGDDKTAPQMRALADLQELERQRKLDELRKT